MANIPGNWCMAMPGVGSIVMLAAVMGGVAGKLPLPTMVLLCWCWFASVNIGMTGNVDGSGSIPNGVGVVTVGGGVRVVEVRREGVSAGIQILCILIT